MFCIPELSVKSPPSKLAVTLSVKSSPSGAALYVLGKVVVVKPPPEIIVKSSSLINLIKSTLIVLFPNSSAVPVAYPIRITNE